MRVGRLYVITDVAIQSRFSHEDLVRAALAGGADTIQLRDKSASSRGLLQLAVRCSALCRRRRVPFLVNDRTDVALAADADGVHLGDDDLPIEVARSLLGPHRILGASADTLAEVHVRAQAGADYCGIGPVFPTRTKADTGPVLGLEGLREVVRGSPLPLVAIGGIDLDRLPDVLATGVHGVAMVGAISGATDPEAAVRRAREILDAP